MGWDSYVGERKVAARPAMTRVALQFTDHQREVPSFQ